MRTGWGVVCGKSILHIEGEEQELHLPATDEAENEVAQPGAELGVLDVEGFERVEDPCALEGDEEEYGQDPDPV